ncbi:hypothetical protein BDB01DRAFT_814630 [Pilobolus umbonatus]|nr:hypothetical protein BDB01DRAFT_814630 [Pilobolus umbonatus]
MFIYVLNLTETTSHGINECVHVSDEIEIECIFINCYPLGLVDNLNIIFSGIPLLTDNQYYYG